jgi:hypothetical protein
MDAQDDSCVMVTPYLSSLTDHWGRKFWNGHTGPLCMLAQLHAFCRANKARARVMPVHTIGLFAFRLPFLSSSQNASCTYAAGTSRPRAPCIHHFQLCHDTLAVISLLLVLSIVSLVLLGLCFCGSDSLLRCGCIPTFWMRSAKAQELKDTHEAAQCTYISSAGAVRFTYFLQYHS